MKLRKQFVVIVTAISLCLVPCTSKAFFDTPVLLEILANAIKQYIELRNIFQTGVNQLNLLREINRGLNDIVQLAQTAGIQIDPGLFKDLRSAEQALAQFQQIYGIVVDSPEARVQRNTDQVVAESVAVNNELYSYATEIDRIGNQIKDYSRLASPGGAQKLTAQSMGVMIHVLNQGLRAQATGLKLQASYIAQENKKEKDQVAGFLKSSDILVSSLKNSQTHFERPRF
jgi:hypothetical protein